MRIYRAPGWPVPQQRVHRASTCSAGARPARLRAASPGLLSSILGCTQARIRGARPTPIGPRALTMSCPWPCGYRAARESPRRGDGRGTARTPGRRPGSGSAPPPSPPIPKGRSGAGAAPPPRPARATRVPAGLYLWRRVAGRPPSATPLPCRRRSWRSRRGRGHRREPGSTASAPGKGSAARGADGRTGSEGARGRGRFPRCPGRPSSLCAGARVGAGAVVAQGGAYPAG